MKTTLIATAIAVALTVPAAWADAGDAENIHEARRIADWAHDYAAEMRGSMAYMFSDRVGRGKVVKGAPYSADVVTEMNQTLADGNVIAHRNASRVYRDGEGRMRQETWRDDKLRSFYISDPVGGVAYTVLPDSKMAVAIPRIGSPIETRIESRGAPRPRPEPGKAPGEDKTEERKIVIRTVEGDGGPGTREEVRVQVIRMGDGEAKEIVIAPGTPAPPVPPLPPLPPAAAMPPIPGVHTMRFESPAHLGKGATVSLGQRDFEGVKAEGKATTWTIAAGQIGNKNAINVTSETWYSPDLQVTMYTRYNDPRTGESIYRLANIKRAEPAADLFKVPEGFTVKGRRL